MEKEDRAPKSAMALRRCAKAALLLYSFKSLHGITQFGDEETCKWKREIQELKIQLLRERSKNNKIKHCALLELFVQVVLLLSLWTFFLLLFLKSR